MPLMIVPTIVGGMVSESDLGFRQGKYCGT